MDRGPVDEMATRYAPEVEGEMSTEYCASFDGPAVSEPALTAVRVGVRFVFRTKELLGQDYRGKRPSFEGQVVTVVGFKPRYVNSVVVRDEAGTRSLLPPDLVERALRHEQEQN